MEKYSLKNRWMRIALAVLFGAILQETFHIFTGRDSVGWFWVGTIFCYLTLSFWIHYKNLYDLNKIVKKEEQKKANDTIIDN